MRIYIPFLALIILCSCAREKPAFNSDIAKGKSFQTTVDKTPFLIETPKSYMAGNTVYGLATIVGGFPMLPSSKERNIYGYDIEPDNELTEQISKDEAAKIKNALPEPADEIASATAKMLEQKYGLSDKGRTKLKFNEKGKVLKDGLNADYVVNFTSVSGIDNSMFYGNKYKFRYKLYFSINDVTAYDNADKYDTVVITDVCKYEADKKLSYKHYMKDDAAAIREYFDDARNYCIGYFARRIVSGELGAEEKNEDKGQEKPATIKEEIKPVTTKGNYNL